MIKERIKCIIIGLLIGSIFSGILVFSKNKSELLEVVYSDIKLSVNGKEITPKDVNGNIVEPFIVNGTTYLPVRAVASALDKKVAWDGETNTVILSEPSKVIADLYQYNYCDPEKYVNVIGTDNPSNVVFEAEGTVTDFKIIKINSVDTDNKPYTYELVDILYQKDFLESGDYVVAGIWFAGYFPQFGIMYTDDSGEVNTLGISDPDQRGEGLHRLSLEEINLIIR